MTPFVVIGCGAAKRNLAPGEKCAAVDLYTGSLFRSRLAYARALGGPHAIVSARHGVVPPEMAIAPYEEDLRKRSKREREAWADRVAHHIAQCCPAERPIVALVSGPYALPFLWLSKPHRDRAPRTVTIPASGLALGAQRAELGRLTRERVEADHLTSMRAASLEFELAWFDREFATVDDDEEVTLEAATLRALLARRAA